MTELEHRLAARSRERANFRRLWKLLAKTYAKYPHAFHKGCGQETMAYWVRDATGRLERPKELRRALNYASDIKGYMRCVREPGCTTRYFMQYR